ncbi:PP2C family protein-serine/threonine phosphatase [Marinobacter salicampi]|uniref:PP2C family protein-serine/threonine phosphatase n=1 Tax=Marinobacter salicampi TaxID=435907 RepID=UPI001407CCA1|nr:protein phosphatase 2C domain-containing protein [Marinobacter salicampi]
MALSATGVTDTGTKRATNQDAIACRVSDDGEAALAIVADGMGGYEGGGIASQLAVDALLEVLEPALVNSALDAVSVEELIQQAIDRASDSIARAQNRDSSLSKMGTTVVLAWVLGHRVHVAHLGDSRCYRVPGSGPVELKTRDDTVVQNMVDDGSITAAEAPRVPFRNVLTRALGSSSDVTASFGYFELAPGDCLLLCSDGLTDAVPDSEWRDLLNDSPGSLEARARNLLEQSLDNQAADNVSIVLVQG